MIDDMKIGIYEFLLKCKPVLEEDGEYLSDGTVENHSRYHMSCKWQDMETLAYDIGATIRETTGETAWDAIKRYMENEINAEKKETSDKTKWSALHEHFFNLTINQCRYPSEKEDNPPFTFCTMPVLPGGSYCEVHDKICKPNRYKPPIRWY